MSSYIRKPRVRRARKMRRVCLKCDKPFIAEGKFNRICPRCSRANGDYHVTNVLAFR